MTENGDEVSDETGIEEFALPEDVEELVAPKPLAFAPWHKPRKQFVRRHQWIKHARGIVSKLREQGNWSDDIPLRYLTLPGPDLLDIRLLAEVCNDEEIDLHYVGFCQASETDSERLRKNIHQFAIEHGETIRPGSEVHPSRIEDVTIARSAAQTLMKRDGPYDIVNIDACSPIANNDNNRTDRLVDAIREIVQFQIDSRRKPWMLYLTTPLQTDSISEQSLVSLRQQIIENVESDEEFSTELSRQYRDGENLENYLSRVCELNGLEFVRAVTLGVSKWFVHLAAQANYSVKKLEGFCYSVFGEEPYEPNMVSVCYLFMPTEIIIIDESGLTANQENAAETEPVSDHLRALRRSLGLVNLDEKLAEDQDEREQMIIETKGLLRKAGYDVDHQENGYDAWLSSNPPQSVENVAD